MALIKCEECGQMVSDKATACPHCGCPVKRPLVCPECGEEISEGDSYCLKCGCPLSQNTQLQAEEQVNYSWDEDEEKPNNTLKWLLGVLAALVVLGGAAIYAWQSGMFNKPAPLEDTVAIDSTPQMIAPVINLNANGMYTIDDCPSTYEGLEIEPRISGGSLNSVVVKRDGEELQTINVNRSYFENIANVVHFFDANFDNYVDFMVGSGECEESSALFLWSPDESKFVQALSDGNLSFSGGSSYSFCFHPQSQKVYRGGYGDTDVQYLMSWVGNDLRNNEEFIQAFSPSMYYDKINHRYTIIDSKTQKVIFSNDDPKQIPERWKKMARVLTPQEEAEYAEWDNSSYEEEGGNDPSSSTMRGNDGSRELDEIRAQLESERSEFTVYFKQFKSLMQQYGTSSPDPYVYDNLMGSLNRMIEIADKGEKLARQLGRTDEAKWFKSQAQECRNGKNQLIYQH